jgi:hypothetical protein
MLGEDERVEPMRRCWGLERDRKRPDPERDGPRIEAAGWCCTSV